MEAGAGACMQICGGCSWVSDTSSVCVLLCECNSIVCPFSSEELSFILCTLNFLRFPAPGLLILILIQSTRLWINSHLCDRRRMVSIQTLFQFKYLRTTLCVKSKSHSAAVCSSFSAIRPQKKKKNSPRSNALCLILPMCLEQQVLPIWPPLSSLPGRDAASLLRPRQLQRPRRAAHTQLTDRRGGCPM